MKGETIQKDAAIEVVNDVIRQLEKAAEDTELANLFERVAATMIKYKIRDLPLASAEQPEVIRCRDCRYFAGAGRKCMNNIMVRVDWFYCYYAEKKWKAAKREKV